MDRREFLRLSAGLAGLLMARPKLTAAGPAANDAFGVSRTSKLFSGRFVVHSDLHNHSFFSGDAVGDPVEAYAQMLAAGIEVASLTDHAIMGKDHGNVTCPTQSPCSLFVGMNDEAWERANGIARAAYAPGSFVAIRGFEWTSGTLGHINVWFTSQWTDPLHTRSLVTQRGLNPFFDFLPVIGPPATAALGPTIAASPEILASMDGFYEWLSSPPERPLLGGGSDGLAGFNHPNLYGNPSDFRLDRRAASRLVTSEVFTGTLDFLRFREDPSQPEPIGAMLGNSWRLGLIGVSDEHGEQYGITGKGRGGLWVSELTRGGVKEALRARRTFATLEPGMRLDASANGVQMGRTLRHTSGMVQFLLDVAKAGWAGKTLRLQVLRPASRNPIVVLDQNVVVPAEDAAPIAFQVPLDISDGRWVVLRLVDPDRAAADHLPRALGGAVAYSSPWYLAPTAA